MWNEIKIIELIIYDIESDAQYRALFYCDNKAILFHR